MHKIALPSYVQELALKRRGKVHQFDRIDPAKTAHVVVDLQNGFLVSGQPGEVPTARDIIANVNRISRAVRRTGGIVVYLQNTTDIVAQADWPNWFNYFMTPDRVAAMSAAFSPGAFGHGLWEGLEIESADLCVLKRRYSGFIPGSSDLHELLRARGIDTLIITGTVTNVCCESTARDAMMMNYKVVFVSDGNAAFTDEEHNASLATIALLFGDVLSTNEVEDLLARSVVAHQDSGPVP